MAKTSAAVKNRYNDKAYDRITVIVPKGNKDDLKNHAEKHGYKSLNDFINRAIVEKIKRDNGSSSQEPAQPEANAED